MVKGNGGNWWQTPANARAGFMLRDCHGGVSVCVCVLFSHQLYSAVSAVSHSGVVLFDPLFFFSDSNVSAF